MAEQDRLLEKLPFTADACYNSQYRQHEARCETETRVELLDLLITWGKTHESPIFWLSGMAGTGKSTIARTIAGLFDERQTLAASFFFSRGLGNLSSAGKFVGTIARQLACISSTLKKIVCDAISSQEEVLRQGLRNQWRAFVIEPLSSMDIDPKPRFNFVVDALDECDRDDDIALLLQMFKELEGIRTANVGVVVTSRPEIIIRLGFRSMPEILHQELDLRDIPKGTIERDISIFLIRELARIRRTHEIRDPSDRLKDWPKDQDIQSLVERSQCLFIYAATVCRYVADMNWDPQERLVEVLDAASTYGGPTANLDEMYLQVLASSLPKCGNKHDLEAWTRRFRKVVGTLFSAFDLLSAKDLANLLSLPLHHVKLTLDPLHSLLDVPHDPLGPIRLLHPSFRDFLLDATRCEDDRFRICKASTHADLLLACLETISSCLSENMCHLRRPDALWKEVDVNTLEQALPSHVQYACRYWVGHIEFIERDKRDNGKIFAFIKSIFLYWLEVMSLLGKMADAVTMIIRLRVLSQVHKFPCNGN